MSELMISTYKPDLPLVQKSSSYMGEFLPRKFVLVGSPPLPMDRTPQIALKNEPVGRAEKAILKNRFFGRKFHSKNLKNDRISDPNQHFQRTVEEIKYLR